MKYISLFSGIGGFEKGIHQASEKKGIELECVFSSEIDKYARQIYEKNFGVEPYGDITEINERDIPDHDLLVGGFPCQAFSIAGKRCGFEDTRGTLFFEIARIVRVKRPEILLLENVRGLLSHNKGRTFETILKTLDDIGYDVEWQVLNSKNYGVPQNRERVFIIGHLRGSSRRKIFPIRKDDNPFITKGGKQISNAVVSRTLTATDAKMHLDGNYVLVKEATKQGVMYINHKGENNNGKLDDRTLESKKRFWEEKRNMFNLSSKEENRDTSYKRRLAQQQHTQSSRDMSKLSHKNTQTEEEMWSKGLQSTIQKEWILRKTQSEIQKMGKSIQSKEQSIYPSYRIRRLTPIEAERLQGFPDEYTKYGIKDEEIVNISDSQRYKCLGNAVSVPVIEAIITELFK